MAITIDASKAQKILTALKGVDQQAHKYNTTEHLQNVFVNPFGELIVITNSFNHKTIGKIINDNQFQVGKLKFYF